MTRSTTVAPIEGFVYRLVPDRRYVRTASSIRAAKSYAYTIVISHQAREAEVWAVLPGQIASCPVYSVWWDEHDNLFQRDRQICPDCGWGGMNIVETDKGLRCTHCGATFPRFHDDEDRQ
jgi:ribosomal protein S27AE